MKLLLFCLLFSTDSLPTETQLHTALELYYQQQTEAQLIEFQSSTKNDWLRYLPTLGLSYTLDGKPRPTVSWSSNLLYTSQQEKDKRIAKRLSIIRKNELELNKQKLQLSRKLAAYQALQKDIELLHDLFEIDKQLYYVKQDQAKHLEITPTELLKAKQTYLKKEQALYQKKLEALLLESEILILAKFMSH